MGSKLAYTDTDIRVRVHKGRQHGSEFNALQAGDQTEGKRSGVKTGIGCHNFRQGPGMIQDFPGTADKFGAGFRKHGAAGIAEEERYAELPFQSGDMLRQGGLSHMACFRCLAEIAAVCDMYHIIHNRKIHTEISFKHNIRMQKKVPEGFCSDCTQNSRKNLSLFVIAPQTRYNWI